MLALITGGLSKLGSVIATRLAADGYDLALHTHGHEGDEALAARIAGGRRWAIFPAELSDSAALDGLVGHQLHPRRLDLLHPGIVAFVAGGFVG